MPSEFKVCPMHFTNPPSKSRGNAEENVMSSAETANAAAPARTAILFPTLLAHLSSGYCASSDKAIDRKMSSDTCSIDKPLTCVRNSVSHTT